MQAPPSTVTILALALEGLLLPGGLLFGRQLLGSLSPPDAPAFWPAGVAVAMALQQPDARNAALEPLLLVEGQLIPLAAALEAVHLVQPIFVPAFCCLAEKRQACFVRGHQPITRWCYS